MATNLTKKQKRGQRRTGEATDYRPNTGLSLREVKPLTENQRRVFEHFTEKNLLLHGCAGTGKSFLSLYLALREVLEPDSKYKRVVVVRSIVPTRDMGFLPGNSKEKAQVYEAPYQEICSELYGRGDAYSILKQRGLLEFISTSFIRGTTLNDCIVFVDEIANMLNHELDSVVTRAGKNCKMIFSGDYFQSDLLRDGDKNGVLKFMRVLQSMENHFAHVEFSEQDIVRSRLVRDYIVTKRRLGAS